jgi:hypothetical protein
MFRVRYAHDASDELANAWVGADSATRRAITAASHEVDRRLQRDPHSQGESRSSGNRIMFVPPLAVTFRVEKDGRTVSVLQIRLMRQKG